MRRVILSVLVVVALAIATPTAAKTRSGPPLVTQVHAQGGAGMWLGWHVRTTGTSSVYQVVISLDYKNSNGETLGDHLSTSAALWSGAGTGTWDTQLWWTEVPPGAVSYLVDVHIEKRKRYSSAIDPVRLAGALLSGWTEGDWVVQWLRPS